ncbi:MAG: hypothetical protein IVW55_11020 [Chloroflexi bacterium]|nr:hypothetical protein [Chloroflexota bacterium]
MSTSTHQACDACPVQTVPLRLGSLHNRRLLKLPSHRLLEKLEWYGCRWGIEVWHKVLKSGCKIEARQLASEARLERALAVYSVIAWRLIYATMLARAIPDAPCTLLLEQEEWEAL